VTPAPTPRPVPKCTVVNLLETQTVHAEQAWNDAGFSGSVTFDPAVPPEFKIKWQSLSAGSSVACTSGITVRREAP
jgi:hypothetical protein